MKIRIFCTLLGMMALPTPALAEESFSVSKLRQKTLPQLDALFLQGTIESLPCGVTRGYVVHLADVKYSRTRSALQSLFWKGKVFLDDGEFINRFCGFRADRSNYELGISWFDGKPCLVLEYPPSAMIFANSRDEIRQIGPGVYLGRFYERCPCQKLKGYFVLYQR